MLKKDLEQKVKVLESVLKKYKDAEKYDSARIKELEKQVDKLHNSEIDAIRFRKAMIDIFKDALNTQNMGNYTPKGLMNLMAKKLCESSNGLDKNDLIEMFE